MRFNDLLIGCWGLFREVHRADVLGKEFKKQTASNSLPHQPTSGIHCVSNYSNRSEWVRVYVFASVQAEVCVCMYAYLKLPSTISQPPLQHTPTHPHRLLQKTGPRQGEQMNQLHLCSSNQTRLLSGSSSPTWKGLANQRLL